jgi:hypothetical protein
VRIERVSWFRTRYAVTDALGRQSLWEGQKFRDGLSTEVDGHRYEFRPDGRRRIVLLIDGGEAAEAIHWGHDWQVHIDDSSYDLVRGSRWRSRLAVESAGEAIGSVTRARGARTAVDCDLPTALPTPVQAFIGFVAMMLWRQEATRAAGSAGTIGVVA